jgi:hypothetical protein
VITTNGDQNLDSEAGLCEASFTATASATDNCSVGTPTGARSDGLELTDPYPVGETTITWNVSDVNGNPATEVIQTITVTDTQIPVITTNGDQNLDSEAGLCEASFMATASATDNCSVGTPTGARSDGLELTDPYPVGETTITWNVSDVNGNPATEVIQTVNVTDNQIPVITTNGDQNLDSEAGLCEASFTVTASAIDNCSVGNPTGLRSDGLELTDPYPVGETTITWNVSDIHGNPAIEVTQTIRVTDTQIPVITTNGDQNLDSEAGLCEASFTATAFATDNCSVGDPTGLRSDGLELTDPYPVGETTITWNVSDIHGNPATEVIQTIRVTDNQAIVINCPSDISSTVQFGQSGKAIFYDLPTATDNCGIPTLELIGGLASGEVFPLGATTVTYRATDAAGKTAICSFKVTITESDDNEKPVISDCPIDIAVSTDPNNCNALVNWTAPSATDNSGSVTLTSNFEPGSIFPVGITQVIYTATDMAGNQSICSFNVTVTDAELPVITTNGDQNLNAEAGLCAASFTTTATASDNCSVDDPTGVRSDGQLLTDPYPVGETTITWNVSDVNGNAAEVVIQTITVIDNQLPVITSNGDQNLNAEAGLCEASFTATASAMDNCSVGDPTGVRSDGQLLTDPYSVGITTITWTVTDINNNAAAPVEQTVTVNDTELPTVITRNRIFTIENGETLTISSADINNGSFDNCGILDFELDITTFSSLNEGENTVILTVRDVNGNSNSASAIVTVLLKEVDSDGDGFTPSQGDCNDFDDTIYPGAPEICDGKDNDCDGLIDDEDPDVIGLTTYYRDQDGDGYGNASISVQSCNMPAGYITDNSDCDDSDELKNPGISGSCDQNPCSEDLVISSIIGPLDPKPINTVLNVSAIVIGNPVEAYWDWDDGTTTSIVDFNSGFEAIHIYTNAGVYQIALIVIDACGREVERLTDLAVVYDPNGGFVTGGGTIWSPKGAYLANLEVEGRANFGFVAKYKKGSNSVDGNTEFQFKNGGLNFHSSSYDDMSLVIAGYKAIYKGLGTINGQTGYSFMVSAVDGNKKAVTEPDKFRIKIWKSATSEIIYDNQYGASERDDATTNLTGGSIVIHSPNKGNNKSNRESELLVVDWKTSKEVLLDKLNKVEEELTGNAVIWDMSRFDPVSEGIQFVEGLLIDSDLFSISGNIQAAVLVLDKSAPTDIILSGQVVPVNVKEGDIIGLLETIDPADEYHEYSMGEDSNFYIEENRLIWKGGSVESNSFVINVSSMDIVGNVLGKSFTLTPEGLPNTVLVYPNPASKETNVKIDFSQPSIVTLKMFDAAGRLVFEESGDYEKGFIRKIDLRELSNGLYQIQVQINFETITKRLVKVN